MIWKNSFKRHICKYVEPRNEYSIYKGGIQNQTKVR